MQALFPGVYVAEMQIPSEALLILIQTQVTLDLEDQMAMPHQNETPAATIPAVSWSVATMKPYIPSSGPKAALKRRIWRFCSRFLSSAERPSLIGRW